MSRSIKSDNGSLSGIGAGPHHPGVDVPARTVVVHRFTLNEYDDPDLFAGRELYDWTKSDAGKWILDRCIDTPTWRRTMRIELMAYEYVITAKLSESDITVFLLRWR